MCIFVAEEEILRYEHLVQINDPLFPLADPLSREQVWRGLVHRAYAPENFVLGLDASAVEELPAQSADKRLARTLDFGAFEVRDVITLHEQRAMVTDVAAGPGWPRSRLTISIEEPETDQLFLRFLYEWDEPDASSELDSMTLAIRERAYFAADLDTVAKIRALSARPTRD